jgi:hypothetical protein
MLDYAVQCLRFATSRDKLTGIHYFRVNHSGMIYGNNNISVNIDSVRKVNVINNDTNEITTVHEFEKDVRSICGTIQFELDLKFIDFSIGIVDDDNVSKIFAVINGIIQ